MRDQPAFEHSTIVTGVSRVRSRLVSLLLESRLSTWNARASATLGRAASHSVLARSLRAAGGLARDSRCYRWLTAEPDPDVVVVDLRETRTVGPIIAAVDRVGRWLSPTTSRLGGFGGWVGSAVTERPVQLLSLLVVLVSSAVFLTVARTGVSAPLLAVSLALAVAAVGCGSVRLSWSELATPHSLRVLAALLSSPEPDNNGGE